MNRGGANTGVGIGTPPGGRRGAGGTYGGTNGTPPAPKGGGIGENAPISSSIIGESVGGGVCAGIGVLGVGGVGGDGDGGGVDGVGGVGGDGDGGGGGGDGGVGKSSKSVVTIGESSSKSITAGGVGGPGVGTFCKPEGPSKGSSMSV